MSTTREALRHAIDAELRAIHGSGVTTGTATGGSTSTLIDTARTEADDYWNEYWLLVTGTTDEAAPEAEESRVSDYSASTTTLTVAPGLTAAIGAGDTYELRRFIPASSIHRFINSAVEQYRNQFPDLTEDSTIVVKEDVYDYTLPSGVVDIRQIDLIEHDVVYRGTATAGDSTTLTDTSKSWTTDELAGHEIAIYDGTGSGQYRTIASNTATVITVTVAWATNPSTDSDYVVKDVTDEPPIYHHIQYANFVGSTLHIPQALLAGHRLRIQHNPEFSELDDDADTTDVPKALVVRAAMRDIALAAPGFLPDSVLTQDRAVSIHDRYETWVNEFIARNRPTHQTRTWWSRGGAQRTRWNTAVSGWSIGNKKEQ